MIQTAGFVRGPCRINFPGEYMKVITYGHTVPELREEDLVKHHAE
jgi:hypothetical protein